MSNSNTLLTRTSDRNLALTRTTRRSTLSPADRAAHTPEHLLDTENLSILPCRRAHHLQTSGLLCPERRRSRAERALYKAHFPCIRSRSTTSILKGRDQGLGLRQRRITAHPFLISHKRSITITVVRHLHIRHKPRHHLITNPIHLLKTLERASSKFSTTISIMATALIQAIPPGSVEETYRRTRRQFSSSGTMRTELRLTRRRTRNRCSCIKRSSRSTK